MSRSALATPPSLCSRSTWPRISSVGREHRLMRVEMDAEGRSMSRTSFSIAMRHRPEQRHRPMTPAARSRATCGPGSVIAMVFGSTSAKTMTRSDIAIVA